MAEYVCELALLQSDLGPYPQAEIAASAVLLARLALKKGTGKFEFSSTLFMVSYGILNNNKKRSSLLYLIIMCDWSGISAFYIKGCKMKFLGALPIALQ